MGNERKTKIIGVVKKEANRLRAKLEEINLIKLNNNSLDHINCEKFSFIIE